MQNYKTENDWTRNKNSKSIIYPNADGSTIEISLDAFLESSPENTVEMFRNLKTESDKLFQEESVAEGKRTKYELPLLDWSEKFVAHAFDGQYIDSEDEDSREVERERREQMLATAPAVLDKLTEVQRRRFMLHKAKGLTTSKIAETEGISHQSVLDSIHGAEKKIKKYLLKCEQNVSKHPAKPEDY